MPVKSRRLVALVAICIFVLPTLALAQGGAQLAPGPAVSVPNVDSLVYQGADVQTQVDVNGATAMILLGKALDTVSAQAQKQALALQNSDGLRPKDRGGSPSRRPCCPFSNPPKRDPQESRPHHFRGHAPPVARHRGRRRQVLFRVPGRPGLEFPLLPARQSGPASSATWPPKVAASSSPSTSPPPSSSPSSPPPAPSATSSIRSSTPAATPSPPSSNASWPAPDPPSPPSAKTHRQTQALEIQVGATRWVALLQAKTWGRRPASRPKNGATRGRLRFLPAFPLPLFRDFRPETQCSPCRCQVRRFRTLQPRNTSPSLRVLCALRASVSFVSRRFIRTTIDKPAPPSRPIHEVKAMPASSAPRSPSCSSSPASASRDPPG